MDGRGGIRGVLSAWVLVTGACAPRAAVAETNDKLIWQEFLQWSKTLERVPAGEHATVPERYVPWLVARGVSPAEAEARMRYVNTSRHESLDRERPYWNARYKLGGGPDNALLLLQQTVRDMKPGRALDPAMGRGRNGIYLASMGWDVTGYDMSPDALAIAQSDAQRVGVRIKTVLATHESFDYGTEAWDLIVIAYAYMLPLDPQWPPRLWRALKPGGLIVMQAEYGEKTLTPAKVMDNWRQFRILRYEQPDSASEDWQPKEPFIRMILRKPPATSAAPPG